MSSREAKATAEPVRLYSTRGRIYPKRVMGPFRRLKWIIMSLTLAIYYVTPWLRWDRGPYAPSQAVLVDLAGRRFFFGPVEIWPQEFYYVAGLLIMAGLGLFLVTSSVGRAWCGYACPQTVWTDLMVGVEDRIIGDRNARMKLDKAPLGFEKIWKLGAVHLSWLVIAVATGGAWVFYFADAPTLFHDLMAGEAAREAYGAIAVLTFTTYALGGIMREQVCTYMCPWPRIQSAMLDEHSFIVSYKAWRGEPRGSVKSSPALAAPRGDCVDCMACVNVCPTGIDIRNGPQLECITCALCVDACNDVMQKLGRPLDLVGYTTLARDREEAAGKPLKPMWRTILRPRTLAYLTLWAGIGVAMLTVLAHRGRMDLHVLQDRNPTFVQLSDGDIRNGYNVKILNMEARPRRFLLTTERLPGARLTEALTGGEPRLALPLQVGPDSTGIFHVYVRAPLESLRGERTEFSILARETGPARPGEAGEIAEHETRFTGPAR